MKDSTIIILVIFMIIMVVLVIFRNSCRDFENPRCIMNGISIHEYEQYKCEKNGGLFFSGGLFSSNNCVIR